DRSSHARAGRTPALRATIRLGRGDCVSRPTQPGRHAALLRPQRGVPGRYRRCSCRLASHLVSTPGEVVVVGALRPLRLDRLATVAGSAGTVPGPAGPARL